MRVSLGKGADLRWNLTEGFQNPGKEISTEISLENGTFSTGSETCSLVSGNSITLKALGSERNKLHLSGEVDLVFTAHCDRCLTETQVTIPIRISRDVISPDSSLWTPEGEAEQDGESLTEYMDGYELCCDELLHNEISLNWPVKILCKDDCKGLCPVCGGNLNVEDCGCDTFVPDPRMAAIKDIFEKSKESKEV